MSLNINKMLSKLHKFNYKCYGHKLDMFDESKEKAISMSVLKKSFWYHSMNFKIFPILFCVIIYL